MEAVLADQGTPRPARRKAVASLAGSMEQLLSANLGMQKQLEALTLRQQQLEQSSLQPSSLVPAHQAALRQPISSGLMGAPSSSQMVAQQIGTPPRTGVPASPHLLRSHLVKPEELENWMRRSSWPPGLPQKTPWPRQQALYQMIQQKPCLNTSKLKGSVWIQLRAERLGTLLFHVRRLGRGIGDQSLCANSTGLEYAMVQETLKKVQFPDDEPQPSDKSKVALKKAQGAATLKKDAATLKKDANTLKKDAATLKKDVQERRKLKKTRSDVSDEGHANLQEAMGFKKPAAALKKPKAASKPLKKDLKSKKPSTSSPLKKGKTLKKADRKPWVQIRKTMAKKPERAYLVGAHHTLEKVKLIVVVSYKKNVHYSWVIDKIWEALLKDHLTKAEAVQMREELCCQYP
eukprot:s1376_g15.t1